MENQKTIFCDIDGTLVKHENPSKTAFPNHVMELLPGTIEKILEWNKEGHYLILTTGRRESQRTVTEKQLQAVGIFYDILLMGVGRGKRVVINDKKPDGTITADSINLDRDTGIANIKL